MILFNFLPCKFNAVGVELPSKQNTRTTRTFYIHQRYFAKLSVQKNIFLSCSRRISCLASRKNRQIEFKAINTAGHISRSLLCTEHPIVYHNNTYQNCTRIETQIRHHILHLLVLGSTHEHLDCNFLGTNHQRKKMSGRSDHCTLPPRLYCQPSCCEPYRHLTPKQTRQGS